MRIGTRTTLALLAGMLGLVLTSAASAAAVDGKWKWSMGQGERARDIVLTLKADGEKLTGSITTPGRQGGEGRSTEISEGTIKGDEIAFSVTRERQGTKFTTKYTGKIEGDTIKGKITMPGRDGGDPIERDWTATRVKEEAK